MLQTAKARELASLYSIGALVESNAGVGITGWLDCVALKSTGFACGAHATAKNINSDKDNFLISFCFCKSN